MNTLEYYEERTKEDLVHEIAMNVKRLEPLLVALPKYKDSLNREDMVNLLTALDVATIASDFIYEDIENQG